MPGGYGTYGRWGYSGETYTTPSSPSSGGNGGGGGGGNQEWANEFANIVSAPSVVEDTTPTKSDDDEPLSYFAKLADED